VPLLERLSIVESVRHVDAVVPQVDRDKLAAWRSLRFDVVFVGDTARGTMDWVGVERDLTGAGVAVEYLPATYAPDGALLDRGLDDLLEE
jgi:glycerol-3-phosphate cytidylyltransferase-like family protein